jgi:multiple sugar transport system permease protein
MSSKRKVSRLYLKEEREAYLFLLPWMLGFIFFTSGPMIASLILSLFEWNGLTSPIWTGVNNYINIFHDPLFWQSLKVTSLYSFGSIPIRILFGLLIAILMNQAIKGIGIFRTIYYLPSVVSGVAVAVLWRWLLNPDFGLINILLSKIGLQGPAWLYDEKWVIPAFILMSLWSFGSIMIVFLASLQGVPTELYEAAKVDGANPWNIFWKITIPLISPALLFNLINSIIGSFQVFTAGYIMTNGGPANASLFYVLYLYRNAFVYFQLGYSSALAYILFLIILGLTILMLKSSSAWVYYQGGIGR